MLSARQEPLPFYPGSYLPFEHITRLAFVKKARVNPEIEAELANVKSQETRSYGGYSGVVISSVGSRYYYLLLVGRPRLGVEDPGNPHLHEVSWCQLSAEHRECLSLGKQGSQFLLGLMSL